MQGNGLVLNSVSIKDGRHSWVLPITKTKKKKKKGVCSEGQNGRYLEVFQLILNISPATLAWELSL